MYDNDRSTGDNKGLKVNLKNKVVFGHVVCLFFFVLFVGVFLIYY